MMLSVPVRDKCPRNLLSGVGISVQKTDAGASGKSVKAIRLPMLALKRTKKSR